MENVVLIIHLLITLALIGVVLLQRSEGGGLGIGGGGGGMASGRTPQTPLGKVTWGLGACFIATTLTLAVLGGGGERPSIFDGLPGGAQDTGSGASQEFVLPEIGSIAGEEDGGGGSITVPPAAD